MASIVIHTKKVNCNDRHGNWYQKCKNAIEGMVICNKKLEVKSSKTTK